MRHGFWKAALPLAIIASVAAPAAAQGNKAEGPASALSGWTFSVAPYTYHFNRAKKENDFEPDVPHSYVWLLTAEKRLSERNFAGFAWFSNSFGQPTQYLYYGWRFEPLSSAPKLFLKVTAGVIHGYKEPFHKKIPFNSRSGWGVTAIPAVGWQFTPEMAAQVNVLGTAGLMFQFNYTFK
ncbi:hypothetical protein [Ottowia thiooxydans]|uniref:hypothetical protein n=1 Tax=Ottowia thiooxydans TaxID=219182 RepID=UPI00041D219A|nr:hypothetical protein [Ottowia thiooxydans]